MISQQPFLSIIVPTTRPSVLRRGIIEPLASETDADWELIQVDDRKGVPELSYYSWHRTATTNGSCGPASARNCGAELARGDILVFLDDDITVSERFVSQVRRSLELLDGGAILLAVEHHPLQMSLQNSLRNRFSWLGLPDRLEKFAHGDVLPWRLLQSCSLVLESSRFSEIGGFDSQFNEPHYEDLDLSLRLNRAGIIAKLSRKCTVKHLNWRDAEAHLHWSIRNGYWKRVFAMKYPEVRNELLKVWRPGAGTVHLPDCELVEVDFEAISERVLGGTSKDVIDWNDYADDVTRLGLHYEWVAYRTGNKMQGLHFSARSTK